MLIVKTHLCQERSTDCLKHDHLFSRSRKRHSWIALGDGDLGVMSARRKVWSITNHHGMISNLIICCQILQLVAKRREHLDSLWNDSFSVGGAISHYLSETSTPLSHSCYLELHFNQRGRIATAQVLTNHVPAALLMRNGHPTPSFDSQPGYRSLACRYSVRKHMPLIFSLLVDLQHQVAMRARSSWICCQCHGHSSQNGSSWLTNPRV